MANSSVTETHTKRGPVGMITFTVTADSEESPAGTVADHTVTTKFSGILLALETNPGATAPTDNYDITIDDGDGHDVLEGVGGNRDTANTEKVAIVYSGTAIHPPVSKEDTLTFKVANNSVSAATLTAKLYYEGESDGPGNF